MLNDESKEDRESGRVTPRCSGPVEDLGYLGVAFDLAEQVARSGNVPVGAVLVVDGEVVGRAGNLRETLQDPTAHAELLALREASQRLGRWRLEDATLYVTLEPCAMCAGAIVQSRIGRVVYAATEPKTGAHQSVHRLFEGTATRVEQHMGSAERSAQLLGGFFEGLRGRAR